MLFNSYIFILAFIPLCLFGYFLLNRFNKYNLAQAFLLGMSLWFYGYFNYYYLLIIISSILINYLIYRLLGKTKAKNKSKALMIIGVVFNLGLLGVFKYTDFFISTANSIFKSDFNLFHIVLPLGISFFTFQQVSFIVDAYRGEIPGYGFLQYASFVAFFPQLIAGPIVTHDELVPQFADVRLKKFNVENLASGLFMFTLGLSKKVLIADRFSDLVSYGFVAPDRLNTPSAWVVMISYTFQIYFDFSGYSDMAIGLAKMFNIDIPINFDSPYKSLTISEFWGRWHITLSRFMTKYVYIPLGGNRKGKIRTYINLFIVFFLSGFWHGAGWNYILWGVLNGIGVIFVRINKKWIDKLHPAFNWIVNAVFTVVSMTVFRAPTIKGALAVLKPAFSLNLGPVDSIISGAFRFKEIVKVLAFIHLEDYFPNIMMVGMLLTCFIIVLACPNSHTLYKKFKPNVLTLLITVFLFMWSFMSVGGVSAFLYFNF